MNQEYNDSTILYAIDKAYNGKVTLNGIVWYTTIVSTGLNAPAPSHKLLMENANRVDFTGAALFRNDPGKASVISGRIEMFKSYYVDVYQNESKDPGGSPFLTLKFKERVPKPTEQHEGTPTATPTATTEEKGNYAGLL